MTSTERSNASRRRMRQKLDRVSDLLLRLCDLLCWKVVSIDLGSIQEYDRYNDLLAEARKELES